MHTESLHYLLAIAEAGTFGKAGARLGIEASTLTRRMAALEDELGATLLERRRTGVRPTAAGAIAIAQARRILAAAEAMRDAVARAGAGDAGDLRLGVRVPPVGEPLRSLLAKWRAEQPGVALTLCELNDHDLHLGVESRRLDVALVAGEKPRSRVVTEPLYRERIVAALPSDHPLAAGEALRWSDLRRDTILVQDWSDSHDTRELYVSLLGLGFRFSGHAASKQSIMGLVGAGFGVTLAVESQAQVAFPGVVFKPIDQPNAFIQVMLAWAADAEDAMVGRFIAVLRDAARSRAVRN